MPELSGVAAAALVLTATTYESGSVHMDFRDAMFRVGGEGGSYSGGGGGGGVLTIVGLSRLPADLNVRLDGESGTAPGGGGGGGGVITFQGRPAESEDQHRGLRVSSFFAANALTHSGLLNALEAGWSHCPLPTLPYRVNLNLGFVVECGDLSRDTMIRMDLRVADPNGVEAGLASVDVAVPDHQHSIRRAVCRQRMQFEVTEYGVWSILLMSGSTTFASYPIEFTMGEATQT
jgi:hypothetical protein